jgi:membrane protein YdbS with pleckstrin-like domain
MAADSHFTIGETFRPAGSFVRWYKTDFLFFLGFLILVVFLPAVIASQMDPVVTGIVIAIILLTTFAFFTWIRLYYESMVYQLREDEVNWKRGVWFRRTGIVPYNRITNLDLVQGPVMRAFGISSLAIQTAGYSGQTVPEIRIEGIEHAEELRELIRDRVRKSCRGDEGTGGHPAPAAASVRGGMDERVLSELVAIRQLLEKGAGR